MNSNQRKAAQLGMPHGTAQGRLRKMILFSLLQRLDEDICHQCGYRIATVEELSIEHKIPWLNNSVDLFWDLGNIAFSHLSCNASAANARRKVDPPLGKRWCWMCKQFLDTDAFSSPREKRPWDECRSCHVKRQREYRRKIKSCP